MRLIFLCVFAACVAVASPLSAQEAREKAATETGAYALRLKGLDGKFYDVAEMRGEVVLVSFGATWCAPCAWELFALEELKEEYKGKPVRFLWVSIESEKQTPNSVLRQFMKSYRVHIPVLRDPSKEAFAQFSSSTRIPLVVFFDASGQFAAPVHRGMSAEPIEYKQSMRARINALLQRAAPLPNSATTTGGNATQ